MRDILVAGNWKMNGSSAANAELVAGIVAGVPEGSGFSLLVCPHSLTWPQLWPRQMGRR